MSDSATSAFAPAGATSRMAATASSRPRVVVIGAGVAGLSAAWELSRTDQGAAAGTAPEVVLLEAGPRAGGVLRTERRDGWVIERGPDSMIREKPWAIALCKEIGLGDELIGTQPAGRASFIARGDKLYPVPEGFHLMAPSRIRPLVTSRLFSLAGKARMAADLVLPARRDGADESLADFVRRRLGREALDYAAQPMVGGIYTADPEHLSVAATMPRFLDIERRHRSLVLGMIASRKRQEAAAVGSATGPRYDLFMSLVSGLERLPERLVELLPEGCLRLATPVAGVARADQGPRAWMLELRDGTQLDADAVIVATPAWAAAELLRAPAPALAADLAAIRYASSMAVNLLYRSEDLPRPLEGFGFVVPAVEKRTALACTFSSRKYAGRAPEGHELLRCFAGGALFPEKLELSDERIVDEIRGDLRDLLGITSPPRDVIVSRWHRAMAQYDVGHTEVMRRVDAALAYLPGLELVGNGYRGIGIPDCVRQGRAAALRLRATLAR